MVETEGALIGEHDTVVALMLRYPEQAYELEIIVPQAMRAGLDARRWRVSSTASTNGSTASASRPAPSRSPPCASASSAGAARDAAERPGLRDRRRVAARSATAAPTSRLLLRAHVARRRLPDPRPRRCRAARHDVYILPGWQAAPTGSAPFTSRGSPVMELDRVLLEIFFHKVTAVPEEMAITLQRTARTTYRQGGGRLRLRAGDAEGRFFAYPKVLGVSGFLDSNVGPALARIPDLEPGRRRHHQPPLRQRGWRRTCRTFTSSGRSSPRAGSLRTRGISSTRPTSAGGAFVHLSALLDLYQEGFQIPPVKLVKAGRNERGLPHPLPVQLPHAGRQSRRRQGHAGRPAGRREARAGDGSPDGRRRLPQDAGGHRRLCATKALAVQRKIPTGPTSSPTCLTTTTSPRSRARALPPHGARWPCSSRLYGIRSAGRPPPQHPTAGQRPVLTLKLMHLVLQPRQDDPDQLRHVRERHRRGAAGHRGQSGAPGRGRRAQRNRDSMAERSHVGALNTASPDLMPAPSAAS